MTQTQSGAEGASGNTRMALVGGLFFLTGGLWLLLDQMGVSVPSFREGWPIFFLLWGVASLIDYLAISRRPRSAGHAMFGIGFGVLGFAISMDFTTWRRALDWLPSLPTILGLSILTAWIAGGRRNEGLPVAGSVLVGIGLAGFAARFDVLQRILPSVQVLWAILLLAVGGFLTWRAFARNQS